MTLRRSGFTLIEVLIAIVIVTIGLLAVIALLTHSVQVSGEVVEDSFAATLARSVYDALRQGASKRAFVVRENGNLVRGFVFVHDGVVDGANYTPPSLPVNATDVGALNALRSSDFAIFLPQGSFYPSPTEVYFLFPRPGGAAAENAWFPPVGGMDDSFYPQNPVLQRRTAPADSMGVPTRFDVQRIYWLKNRPNVPPPGAMPDAFYQYGFAIALRRASAPVLVQRGAPIGWTPANSPPRQSAPQDGLYQAEVMVFRNFEASPTSRSHAPVPGGDYVGLIAVGP
jgi:prepilin-type N-terminal cleavage/methylation domain-containing protein